MSTMARFSGSGAQSSASMGVSNKMKSVSAFQALGMAQVAEAEDDEDHDEVILPSQQQ